MIVNTLPFHPGAAPIAGTPAAADLVTYEGLLVSLQDQVYFQGQLTLLVVKNTSGIALEPKRAVKFATGKYGLECDGYARLATDNAFAIWDQHKINIAANQLMYVVLEGPTLVKTNLAGDATNVITEFDWVVAATAATSQATTAGRIQVNQIAAASTENGSQILMQLLSGIGRALTARTTANTNTDTLVMVHKRF